MVTTKQKSRAETQNIKKKKLRKKIIENHQTKMEYRNTKKKKKWRHRAVRK